MALKPTQFRFQVAAADGISVQANITMDGSVLWAGSLAHTTPTVQGHRWHNFTTPYSSAECEIDLPVFEDGQPTTYNKLMTVYITGGDVALTGIDQKNNPTWAENPDHSGLVYVGGNPEYYGFWNCVTQPLWNGEAILSRYDINDYLGHSGPGVIIIESGETCEFTAELWAYCPVIL